MVTATSTINHYVAISNKYHRQPNGEDMALLTNYMKYETQAERLPIEQLLQYLATGHNAIISNYEIDNVNSFRFVSSSLIMIDIDDDNKETNPNKVLKDFKNECVGLFYTWSHNVKGNRYRLVMQLNEQITNEQDYRILTDYILMKLKNIGLPVDDVASRPTEIVRGGNGGYLMNDNDTYLNVSEWLPKAREFYKDKLEKLEANRQKMINDNMNNPVTYEQLLEMCTKIGHLPSKESHETTQKWLQVTYAIKNCVQMDIIDDQQGYELFNIVSGSESNQKQWNGIKPRGEVSVATIIHYAQANGYVHNKYIRSLRHTPEPIEKEIISNRQYIETDTMIDLIKRNQKLIVDSATGSGKTTATMEAFKQLSANSDDFFIFAAPTIVLAEQIAHEHEVTCIKGGISRIHHTINEKLSLGNKIFVSTYDKMSNLTNHIKNNYNPNANFHIVVDEVHKYTEAYNYRFSTIDKLNDVSEQANSFIGLTGTPEDVLKTDFDKLIKINTGNEKSPLTDFRVFTYDKLDKDTKVIDSGNIMLTSVIRSVLKQSRLIVFINSKERIETISRLLRKENIKHAIVTSDKKQSSTYTDIVNNETVSDDVQVVLTTTVLSDGITIKNKLDWSLLVVSDRQSPIFNPSTVKQISNRFRNQYRYFLMFMRTPNDDYSDLTRFNMESDYNYKLGVADNYVKFLNESYEDDYDSFIASKVEQQNGIYYKTTDEESEIKLNPLFLRHNAMKDKEKYYQTYRQAFIKEVSRLIGKDSTGLFNVNDELAANGSDLTGLLEEVQKDKEDKELSNDELRNNFSEVFTEDIYHAIKNNDDKSSIAYFKANVHSDNVSAAYKNVRIADYEVSFIVGKSVSRRADINSFKNDIESLTHIAVFRHVKKRSVTKVIFNKLEELTGTVILSSVLKDITKDYSKQIKVNKRYVSQKDVKGALKLFNTETSRSNGDNFKKLEPLTIQNVAAKYGITEQQVKESIVKYIETQPVKRQKVMFESVKKEYGINV